MPHFTRIRISFNWQFNQGLMKPLLSSVVWFGYPFDRKWWKNVDCWSAHCYALADGKKLIVGRLFATQIGRRKKLFIIWRQLLSSVQEKKTYIWFNSWLIGHRKPTSNLDCPSQQCQVLKNSNVQAVAVKFSIYSGEISLSDN